MLLSAYEQGLFPWYSEDDPILWHSPDPRCVFFPKNFHVSRSMKKTLKKEPFTLTLNRDFSGVISACAEAGVKRQGSTWIHDELITAYEELHRLGFAHSAEAWQGENLAGGLYGVLLGKAFFAESMFYRVPNASKAALIYLAWELFDRGVHFVDCQILSPHLSALGAREIPREDYLKYLRTALDEPQKI